MKVARAVGPAVAPIDGVVIVRREVDDPARRRELDRLLRALLDKPNNPDEKGRP